MSDATELIYVEADEEITAVVRRVRASASDEVVVVAPGRSRATSSAVALRLLARAASDSSRTVAVVGDGLTRSLAAEAGLPAYASVDDARRGGPTDGATYEPRRAAIHIVRTHGDDETSPRMTKLGAAARSGAGSDDETRLAPTAPDRAPTPRPKAAGVPSRRRARQLGLAILVGALAAVLVGGLVAGVTLLPAATITISPRLVPVSATYEIGVDDPRRESGTVEASTTVVASGRYRTLEPARGTVTFYNFNIGSVEVPAGTLVAAGLQAFETTEPVTVESGRLTIDGRIAAGEAAAPVLASAPGPAANVPAGAINVILDSVVEARLRGFPQNTRPLVANAEPTSGGVDASGPRITRADVAAAVEALRRELTRRAEETKPDLGDLVVVDVPPAEPRLEVPEDLAGTRDVEEVEIAGSLRWEVVAVDGSRVEAEAAERLASDSAIPAAHDLVPETVTVDLGRPVLDGDRVVVPVEVAGSAARVLDGADVRDRVLGLTEAEAEAALAALGTADVWLWPDWVATVPEVDWRVEVRVAEPAP